MQEREGRVPTQLLVCACLSRHPGKRYSVEQVASMVGMYYQAARVPLSRQQLAGKISVDNTNPKQVVYFVTPEQAAAIQAELKEIADGCMRWVVDGPESMVTRPAPAALPPSLMRRSVKPGPPPSQPVLRLLDPAVVSSRLTYLRRLRDNSIFGEDRALKDIIADYEATLARTSAAA